MGQSERDLPGICDGAPSGGDHKGEWTGTDHAEYARCGRSRCRCPLSIRGGVQNHRRPLAEAGQTGNQFGGPTRAISVSNPAGHVYSLLGADLRQRIEPAARLKPAECIPSCHEARAGLVPCAGSALAGPPGTRYPSPQGVSSLDAEAGRSALRLSFGTTRARSRGTSTDITGSAAGGPHSCE